MESRPNLSLALLLLLTAACSSEKGSEAGATPAGQTPAAPPATAAPAAPAASATPAAAKPGSGLNLAAQPGWVAEPSSSAMRKAQFRLPRAEGDAEDASLIVYYFGGQGGTPEANLERWAGQFEQPGGGSSAEAMRSGTRTVAGLKVTDASLSGTYVAETTPGSGERVRKEGWRMLAAIVEASDGPYYVKLVGPEATVARWEASFGKFVEEIAP